MDEAELVVRRTQVGRGTEGMSRGTDWEVAVGPDHWLFVSGLPSTDANRAMVHGADRDLVEGVVARIDEVGCPAIVILAGPGQALGSGFPAGSTAAGTMPFTAADLGNLAISSDPRVRREGPRTPAPWPD